MAYSCCDINLIFNEMNTFLITFSNAAFPATAVIPINSASVLIYFNIYDAINIACASSEPASVSIMYFLYF